MARIIIEAETNMEDFVQVRRRREHSGLSVAETICESIAHAAEQTKKDKNRPKLIAKVNFKPRYFFKFNLALAMITCYNVFHILTTFLISSSDIKIP